MQNIVLSPYLEKSQDDFEVRMTRLKSASYNFSENQTHVYAVIQNLKSQHTCFTKFMDSHQWESYKRQYWPQKFALIRRSYLDPTSFAFLTKVVLR